MRFIALLGFGVLVSACGVVKTNDVDAGVDAPTCGGTVDMGGNCICPARFAPPACTSCAPDWTGAGCSTFTENFNRAAGALGSDYTKLAFGLADDALIVNSRACGDVQSVAILDQLVDSPRLSAQLSFNPGNVEGQEFSFILSSDPTLATLGNLFFAGCDGGGGMCTLRITAANGTPLAKRQLTETIPNGMNTHVTLDIDASNNVTIALTINTTVEQLGAQLPAGFTIQRFGFIVGRDPDGTLSCVDDFSVQVK